MNTLTVVGAVAESCPTTNGRQFPQAASEYAKLAGVLAGFAFTALVFILREGVSGRYARAVEVLTFAFFGLILTSACYAVISGEEPRFAAGRAVSEGVFAAGAFTVAGILLLFAILLLLDAVERSSAEAPAAPRADAAESPGNGANEAEGDFARVKRHLSAITATFVTFVLVFTVAPGTRLYADVADRPVVEILGWVVVGAQFVLSCTVGIAYLIRHARVRGPLETDWRGTSPFALVGIAFVLASTLASQWAGTLAPCEHAHWLAITAAVGIYGLIMAYATIVIGRPWLRPHPVRR